METNEGAENEEVSVSGMKVRVTTVGGSITGTTMSLTIDPKLSVTDFKLLVQDKADTTPEQRGPSRRASKKGVTSEFVRVFLDGHELGDEDATLETCGVKEDSVFSFAVGKTIGNKLRRAMRKIGEDFAEVGDGEILAAVLLDLKERMLGGDPKGTQLLDQLYDIFDTDFGDFEGVHEGYLTPFNAAGENGDHIQWLVEEKVEASFPFKTFFGIPVYTHLYGRQEQRIVGQAHLRHLVTAIGMASTGYFGGPTGQRMACVAHFAGPVGTAVQLNAGGAQVGQTVVSNGRDDFAVVNMAVPCIRTGAISTNQPVINGVVHRPATFQTPAIQNARITHVGRKKIVAQEQLAPPATSQGADCNTPWNTPGGRTIGVHRSGGPAGDMSVVRLDITQRIAEVESKRRSARIATNVANKKQKTSATATTSATIATA